MLKRRRALLAILALAVTFFLWSRPFHWTLRAGEPDARDFAPLIAGAHCLFHACNPYDSNVVEHLFQRLAGRNVFIVPEVPVYPPSSFLAVSPLLLLRWPAMHLAWTLLGGGLLLAVYVFLILRFDLYTSVVAYLPIVFVIQSGIMFPALWVGQPIIIAAGCGLLGVTLLVSGEVPLLAIALLVVSLALKPQVALAPALFLLFRRSTAKAAAAALAFAAALLLAGAALLSFQLHSLSFFSQESANVKLSLQPGRLSDPSAANAGSATFLNLQAPLSRLIPNLHADNLIAYAISLALLAAIVLACLDPITRRNRPYTIIAALVMLSTLPLYHRVFDGLLLIFVIPALAELRWRSRPLYWGVTALSFLWFFSHRLLSHLFPRTALFPYTAFVGVAICLALILSLGVGRHGELRRQEGAALEAGGQPQPS
jgi:hypothetical protein